MMRAASAAISWRRRTLRGDVLLLIGALLLSRSGSIDIVWGGFLACCLSAFQLRQIAGVKPLLNRAGGSGAGAFAGVGVDQRAHYAHRHVRLHLGPSVQSLRPE